MHLLSPHVEMWPMTVVNMKRFEVAKENTGHLMEGQNYKCRG